MIGTQDSRVLTHVGTRRSRVQAGERPTHPAPALPITCGRGRAARHDRGVPRDDPLPRRGGRRADAGPARGTARAVGRGGLRNGRTPCRRRLGRARRRPPPEPHHQGPGARDHDRPPPPPRRAPARRRDRSRVGEGARRGGALGARDLRRRRGEARAVARRSGHVPARQPDPGLAARRSRRRPPSRSPTRRSGRSPSRA